MDRRRLVYAPRAQRDLLDLPKRVAMQVLADFELLQTPPWPPGNVKKLRGCNFWEIKCGEYRAMFWPDAKDVVILRIVNRRDLEAAIDRIDVRALVRWVNEQREGKK